MARLFQLLSVSVAVSSLFLSNAWAMPSSVHGLSSRHEQVARHLHGGSEAAAPAKKHRRRRTCKAPGSVSSSTSSTSSTIKTTTKARPTTTQAPKVTTTHKAAAPTTTAHKSNTDDGDDDNSNSGSSSGGSSSGGSSSGSSGSNTSSGDEQTYLSLHNKERAKRGADPVSWDDDLAAAAQEWANKCTNEHSGGTLGPYGENLAAGTGQFSIADGVNAWIDEASSYNPSNPTFSHWTQVVWKDTTKIGCAVATCDGIFKGFGAAQYYVCEYFPQGNVAGHFAANVEL